MAGPPPRTSGVHWPSASKLLRLSIQVGCALGGQRSAAAMLMSSSFGTKIGSWVCCLSAVWTACFPPLPTHIRLSSTSSPQTKRRRVRSPKPFATGVREIGISPLDAEGTHARSYAPPQPVTARSSSRSFDPRKCAAVKAPPLTEGSLSRQSSPRRRASAAQFLRSRRCERRGIDAGRSGRRDVEG